MNIEAAGQVEQQGAEESEEEQISQNDRSRNPQSEKQQPPENKLQPRQDNCRDIDDGVREDLIIVDHLGKRRRVKNFVDTGGNQNNADKQTHPKQQRHLKKQPEAALSFHDG